MKYRQRGFSLLETLLAVGTLAIGMVFVAGTFLAGTFFTTVSTERTIAITVADEAFAKVRLYMPGPWGLSTDSCRRFDQIAGMPREEYVYPSTDSYENDIAKQYSWRALCRAVEDGSNRVQCTVFVSRRVAARNQYFERIPSNGSSPPLADYPELLRVGVEQRSDLDDPNDLVVISSSDEDEEERVLINDGAVVVDDRTGAIYRVLERLAEPSNTIKLDRPWVQADGTEATDGALWVLSPSADRGRNPFVAIYQTILELRRR